MRQGNLLLYLTSLKVSDLQSPRFFNIERLDTRTDSGYQRVLNESRAKKMAQYLRRAAEKGKAFLPTSIFLATERSLKYSKRDGMLRLRERGDRPFNVVDGQHRIVGLVEAAKICPDISDMEIATTIAVNMSEFEQMCHFYVVNTTQKSVDKGIEQRILARLTSLRKKEGLEELPDWVVKQVEKGLDHKAVQIVERLNRDRRSPWRGNILMANQMDEGGRAVATQTALVSSLKKYVLVPSHPLASDEFDVEGISVALGNYWSAVASLFVDASDVRGSNVFKTNGMSFFHIISMTVFHRLQVTQSYTTAAVVRMLSRAGECLSPEHRTMASAEYWQKGSEASKLNLAGIRNAANAWSKAINASASTKRKGKTS